MKVSAHFVAVICVFAVAFSGCTSPSDSATSVASNDQLHGEVHTELTAYRDDLLQQPAPSYPVGPRGQRAEGTGVFRIRFNYASGEAVAVTIVNSTGRVPLDQASIAALRNWTIKPQTWHQIDVVVRFAALSSTNTRISSGARQFPLGAPASFRPPHSRPP